MAASSGAPQRADRFPIAGAAPADGLSNVMAMETIMPQIGQFTRETSGFTGRVRTLSFDTEFTIVPAEATDAENAPDYRVHLGDEDGPEVGAGWKRTGERAGEYIALILDDPVFLAPIRANLFRNDDEGSAWSLHWTRRPKRDGKV